MSELSFNDLPFEILTEVFRWLDVVSLKNATLTCKMWKNLIESECQWSLDYRRLSSKERVNFALRTNRKLGTVKIEGVPLSADNKIRQILQRHNVVKLTLHRCRIKNLHQFVHFLNFTPNLERIFINRLVFDDASNVLLDHALPVLKKLKNLEIYCSHQLIIKCFQNAKLRTIKIWEDRHWTQWTHGALIEFLLSQEMLTSLTVFRSTLTEMVKLNVPIPFRLTHLSISRDIFPGDLFHDNDHNLLKFVQSQAKHLRELKLGYGIPSTVYECAFGMTKLNSLTLAISELPRDNEFYDRLKVNCSVRTMELMGRSFSVNDHQAIANFYKKLPNISSLSLPHASISSVEASVMAQYLSKIESLSIRCIDKQSIDFVKFPNLKRLHVRSLHAKIDWSAFTKAHPLLTELTIGKMNKDSSLTLDDIDQITTNVDLHSIRLGVGFKADDLFLEIVRLKCKNLKVLELHKSCLPYGLSYNVRINVIRVCNHFQCLKYSDFAFNFSKF